MCGICGIYNRDEVVTSAELLAMNDTLLHRGPDSTGHFIHDTVGLAMRRLSIIDLMNGSQPFFNETKSVVCVCNGEIYNYKELTDELVNKGHRFISKSDAEILPHLYEEYGERFLEKLVGMFAIALFDISRGQLFLARDRMGEKPLYYSNQKGVFLFASELKALLRHKGITTKTNYSALYSYLQYRYIPSPETAYEDFFKLPPANYLVYQNGTYVIKPYWQPESIQIDPNKSFAQAKEELATTLQMSVKSQLISDVPLGAFLSGGVDSSIVVGMMRRCGMQDIRTFSIRFPEKSYDESAYARQVAKLFDTNHTEFEVNCGIHESVSDIISSFDEPFADSSALPVYYLSKMTKQNVTVALSGDGGDELFGGYSRYRGMQLSMRYSMLPLFVRKTFEGIVRSTFKDNDEKIETSVRRKLLRFLDFTREVRANHSSFLPSIATKEFERIFSGRFLDELRCSKILHLGLNYDSIPNNKVLDAMMQYDINWFLPDDILTKVDRMSMRHSLETRAPFLDYRVVELALSLPTAFKVNNGQTKHILKETFKGMLPNDILYRQKQGFVVPLAKWFKKELNSFLRDYLLSSTMEELFNLSSILQMIEDHESGKSDNADQLWTLLCLSVWREKSLKS
ncbi:asparagine synthase (glutamine-hydrolyzing) [Geobacter pelophilus]|uniref:asparagine synthase (glutamine-hydrolyzing) n=1 Tax=Geoanaerobacter pelophilus TaxID=60036 RepID=A0AAW4L0H0_9BACT|nr:asparagine synthase (glutamine-hydrolyzing) [Geoanaerobacter pelophilus]MBT0663012.1 asparagine synthase (glutamine-hydrolyzing) [Geoanaerobacter pelophilus]